jgi:RNA 3'-terminal phosphate cyclase
MLIPYIALAKGKSVFLAREVTEHLETNIWLVEKILGSHFKTAKIGSLYRIEKLD